MKRFEISYDGERITIRREAEERLTSKQKFYIIMTAIGCGTFGAVTLAFFSLLQ